MDSLQSKQQLKQSSLPVADKLVVKLDDINLAHNYKSAINSARKSEKNVSYTFNYNDNLKYEDSDVVFHNHVKNGIDNYKLYKANNMQQTEKCYNTSVKNEKHEKSGTNKHESTFFKKPFDDYDKQGKITNVAEVPNNDIM